MNGAAAAPASNSGGGRAGGLLGAAASRLSVDSGFNLFGAATMPGASSTGGGGGGGGREPNSPRPGRRNSGQMGGGGNSVLVETLRSQLHESNDVNAKLEDKVHTQHDKLVQMSKTVSQLQDVQQRLDAKIADSERRARENEALRAAEKSDLEEVSEGGRREGWREWGWN